MNALTLGTVSPAHEWKAIPLGELLLELRNGLVAVQEKEPPGIPITRIETISHGAVNLDRVRYVRDVPSEKLKRFWLKKGDLLFSHINSDLHLGKTAVVISEVPLLHGMNLLLLRPDPTRLASKFLHHWLDHCRRVGRFMAIAQHAVNQSSLNQQKISSLEIPLPSLDVQAEIVAEIEKQFSRLDEAIASLKRVKANLKRYKAAVLKAAVEGRLVPTEAELAREENRTYETGCELLKHIVDARRQEWKGKVTCSDAGKYDSTGLPPVPEGWVWSRADQVCSSVRDGTHDTPVYVKAGVPLITSKNLTDYGIDFNNVKLISNEDHVEISRRSAVGEGDVLFAMIGTVGNPCEVKESRTFSIKNVGLFKRNSDFLDPAYLCWWLKSGPLSKWLEPRLKGTTQKFAPLGLLREIPLPMPPIREQHRIVAEVDRRMSLIRGVEAQADSNLKRAERLRSSILANMFVHRNTGENNNAD